MMHKKYLALGLLAVLFLSACSSEKSEEDIYSARSGVAALYHLQKESRQMIFVKPSVTLGLFASMYLAQGIFGEVHSAATGIEVQQKILAGQNAPAASETFVILQELGTLLQVDIVDTLNRSTKRSETLDEYIKSLKAMGSVTKQKYREIDTRRETLEKERKERRSIVRKIEKDLKNSLRNEDYNVSASKQEELTDAQSKLAATEANIKQTKTIMQRYEELLDISAERLKAIEANREVLIVGLRVVEMPGIEDFNILEEGRGGRFRVRSDDGEDPFGARYLEDI